jgi:hypothetical protein
MSKYLLRALFAAFICVCALALTLSRPGSFVAAIAATPTPVPSASAPPTPASTTAPGTAITNAATATYSDGTNTYNIQSNTVTVTVQNAPSLVVLTNNGIGSGAVTSNGAQPAASPVPGNTLSDIYTLVNTGNAAGTFQLASAQQTSPTPTPSPNSGSSISGPQSLINYTVTCGSYSNNDATIAAVNSDLSTNCTNIAPGSVVNIAVNYQATATGTVNTQLEAQIAYSGSGTGYNAASSLWASNQYNDTIVADERIDIYKSPNPIASDGTVTYNVYVNNAGYSPANYITDYGTSCTAPVKVCGSALTGPGLLISDKVPLGKTSTPLPVVSMAPTTGASGLTGGETPPKMVYTTDSTGKTGWTLYSGGGVPAGAYYVGVLLTGNSNGVGLLANPTPAATSTPGYVPSATSEVGFTVQIGPMPAGTSIPNYVVAPAGDNKGCMEGPGLSTTAIACDANGANPPSPGPTSTPGDPSIVLATPPPASGTPPPGGSNTAIVSIASLLNGPYGVANAVGCFNSGATPVPFPAFSPNPLPTISPTSEPTCSATDNNNDYTQAVATPNPAATIVYGTTAPANLVAAVSSSVNNPSSSATKIQISFPTLPANLSVANVLVGSCAGTAAPTLSAGVYDLGTVGAGQTVNYCVDYSTQSSPAAYYFQPLFVQVRAAMETSPSVYYNDTWHVVLPGGFEELVKTANMLSNGNCSGAITGGLPSLGVCPGGVIQYAVMYYNTLPATATGTPAEPTAANLSVSNTNFVITENGAAAGSNWGTYTGGLFDPASAANPLKASLTLSAMQTSCGVTTLTCGDTSAGATFGQVGGAGGNALNAAAFTDTIPYNDPNLQPQHYGVLMFATKVK